MEVLKIDNIVKQYVNGNECFNALNNISFSVEEGEFIAIVGASGSGKSTLLHIIAGIGKPTTGNVFIDGTDIFSLNSDKLTIFRRRNIGVVYQFYNLIQTLNVKDNILLPALLDKRNIDNKKLEKIIKTLGLENKMKFMPSQLSGGEQQRVSIGRALINEPRIVLADEPTGNLDTNNSKQIIELFKYYDKMYKQTLVLVTHNEDIALQADRIIELKDGAIIKDQINN